LSFSTSASAADPGPALKPAPPATTAPAAPAPSADAPSVFVKPAAPAESPPPAAIPDAPPPAPSPAPVEVPPPPATVPPPAPSDANLLITDELRNPGYLPGYRTLQSYSMSPYTPQVGALPGGLTPGFGAPMPLGQWTFRFNGFFTASLQGSLNRRRSTTEGQGGPLFHTPPQTLDEYASFVGTSTMPGNWVALNFAYGNPIVTANISINTWSPSDPSTYYQIGSQYFINNAFLHFEIPAFGELKLRANVGYFYNYYGNLSQYGPGIYTQTIIGSPRGVGELVFAEYRLNPELTLLVEHGIIGTRGGKVPDNVVPTGGNANANPIFPAAFVHHLHAGFQRTGDVTVRLQGHWLTNFSYDDRVQQAHDNPVTRFVNEAAPRDGTINVLGIDTTLQHRYLGYLGVAGSYTRGDNASTLKGLQTFGGDSGQTLTERWLSSATAGTGKLFAAGINYTLSLGRLINAPEPFGGDRPDVVINAGFVVAYTLVSPQALPGTTTPGVIPADVDLFNKRLRYKFGADVLYTFKPWMAVGFRADRVAPNSKDSEETFYVISPRVVFKRSWYSHESISIIYGKWFYGPHSHSEASAVVPSDWGLDDQLLALNVNLYW
jgi:hypothetical protein